MSFPDAIKTASADAVKTIDGWWNDRAVLRLQLRKLAIQMRHREDQLFQTINLPTLE